MYECHLGLIVWEIRFCPFQEPWRFGELLLESCFGNFIYNQKVIRYGDPLRWHYGSLTLNKWSTGRLAAPLIAVSVVDWNIRVHWIYRAALITRNPSRFVRAILPDCGVLKVLRSQMNLSVSKKCFKSQRAEVIKGFLCSK